MTIYDQCKLFKSWGQYDANYYRVFVGAGLTTEQFEEITGEEYVKETVTDVKN
ncbi:XkdX family protein [Lactiplantibacillus sp. WILCCON 0030]|uniref:XkdX family protein n=1 Tax=Lactiplantibacillus brownii TaxID=3069269 RepID=A0ABU1A9J5_9LACO|nr:XkdX family protein [Lactiplantibacillus brownii]MDQ7937117.1 XkdX family protein [Lactiplantibacillus brownii]